MIMFHLVLAIMCFCASVSCIEHTDICHYIIDNKCILKNVDYTDIYDRRLKPCTIQDIPKEVTYTVFESNGSTSHGVVNFEFGVPDLVCEYKMVLFINPEIHNAEDCNKYVFSKKDTPIHTYEKNVCLTEPSSCRGNWLVIFYQYIYTGCYSVGFIVNEDYIFVKQEFLKTEFNKSEITEPVHRCHYKSTPKGNGSSTELVTISTAVSLLTGPIGLKLEIVPVTTSYEVEGETNWCRDANPVIAHRFSISARNDSDTIDKNCSIMSSISPAGQAINTIDCNFVIDNSPVDIGYCFAMRILDVRCQKNSLWNPPKPNGVPCAWHHYCTRLEQKNLAIIEDVKKTYDLQDLEIPRIFYLVLFVVVVSIVIAVLIALLILYRRHSKRRITNSLNKKNKSFDEDGSTILELNGSKAQKEKLVKESGIVLLYVKESEQFMNLMSEFRRVLEKHTGCDVYDWWASECWNDVAYTGGYEWITNLIKKDYRVIWMDTLRARVLAATPRKNGYDKLKPLKNSRHNHEVVDFRDNIFPTIVDFAKRTNQKLEQEYQRYFVVRLETFENADKTEDPFADLSPHARYLMPCHLDKLCCQLSLNESYEDEMNTDKSRLRKYLSQESVNGLEQR